MKNVANLFVTQYRLFAPGVLPYQFILTPLGTSVVQALGFRNVAWTENGEYAFQDGALVHGDKTYVVPAVTFSYRRMSLQVLGDSAAANEVYQAVREALSKAWPQAGDLEPVLLTEETLCTADLDFDWSALLNPVVVESMKAAIDGISGPDVTFSLKHMGLQFTLASTVVGEAIKEYGITYGDKTLTVEPQLNLPLSARNYFTASPLGSDAHLRFVKEFENRLRKSVAPGRKK